MVELGAMSGDRGFEGGSFEGVPQESEEDAPLDESAQEEDLEAPPKPLSLTLTLTLSLTLTLTLVQIPP